jgi:hypothetical protein
MPLTAPQMVCHHVLAVSYTLYLTATVLCTTAATAVHGQCHVRCCCFTPTINNGKVLHLTTTDILLHPTISAVNLQCK